MSSSTRRRVTITSSTSSPSSSYPIEVCTLYKDKEGGYHICMVKFGMQKEWTKIKHDVTCLFEEQEGDDEIYLYSNTDREDEETGRKSMYAINHELHDLLCREFNFVFEGTAMFHPSSGCEYCGDDHLHEDECQDWIDKQKKKRKASATSSSSSSSAKKAAVAESKPVIFNTGFSFGLAELGHDPNQQSWTFNSKPSSASGVSRASFSYTDKSPVRNVSSKSTKVSSASEEIPITWRADGSGASGMHWNVGDLILIRDGIYKIMSKNSIVFQRFSEHRAMGVSIINTIKDGDDWITRAIPVECLSDLSIKGWVLTHCVDQQARKSYLKFEKEP